jgi:hypothetical protein
LSWKSATLPSLRSRIVAVKNLGYRLEDQDRDWPVNG